jgi:hypothetical protein
MLGIKSPSRMSYLGQDRIKAPEKKIIVILYVKDKTAKHRALQQVCVHLFFRKFAWGISLPHRKLSYC